MSNSYFAPRLLSELRHYNTAKFAADLMAGLIVGIVALPLAIAFGIVTAIPLVKPTTMGYGMNLMMVPRWQTPNNIKKIPANIVASINPDKPKLGSLTMP